MVSVAKIFEIYKIWREIWTNFHRDVDIERKLLLVTGKNLENETTNRRNEAKVKRVLDNANMYLNSVVLQSYVLNGREKKRQYNERVLQIERGFFNTLHNKRNIT